MFDAVAFAGGGNRCYWQGGFWAAAAPRLGLAPQLVTGVSAGAWTACYSLLGEGTRAVDLVAEGCAQGRPNVDWRGWRRGGLLFPVSAMYRELMTIVLDEAALGRLKSGPEIVIALARKPRRLPLSVAVPLGLATYQIEKKFGGPVHPRGGRAIGFTAHYVRVREMESPEDLISALMASASVPPFMPVGLVGGLAALDGGLVDNVPVEPLEPVEAAGGRTLVLLSRRYKRHPAIPGRLYVEPSRPIAIGQFEIEKPDAIREAFALGLLDGEAFARRMEKA